MQFFYEKPFLRKQFKPYTRMTLHSSPEGETADVRSRTKRSCFKLKIFPVEKYVPRFSKKTRELKINPNF